MAAIGSLTEDQRMLAEEHVGLAERFVNVLRGSYLVLDRDTMLSACFDGLVRAASLIGPDFDRGQFGNFAWYWMMIFARKARAAKITQARRYRLVGDEELDRLAWRYDDREDSTLDYRALRSRIDEAMAVMSPRDRQMMEMRFAGIKQTDIARHLRVSQSTVSDTLRRELGKIGPINKELPHLPNRKRLESTV